MLNEIEMTARLRIAEERAFTARTDVRVLREQLQQAERVKTEQDVAMADLIRRLVQTEDARILAETQLADVTQRYMLQTRELTNMQEMLGASGDPSGFQERPAAWDVKR